MRAVYCKTRTALNGTPSRSGKTWQNLAKTGIYLESVFHHIEGVRSANFPEGFPVPSKKDYLNMYSNAVKKEWKIPDGIKEEVLAHIMDILGDPRTSARDKTRAMDVLVKIDALNIARESAEASKDVTLTLRRTEPQEISAEENAQITSQLVASAIPIRKSVVPALPVHGQTEDD